MFHEGVTLEQAMHYYNLDRELRVLIFSGIGVIEVGFKVRVSNIMSLAHGFFWFENETLFADKVFFAEALEDIDRELKRNREDFLLQHQSEYGTSDRPPSHKIMEILSLGTISKMYKNIKDVKQKNEIASSMLLVNHRWLDSWLISISVLRNLCAHHSRVFGKYFSYPPKEMARPKGSWISMTSTIPDFTELLFYQICAVKYLLNVMLPDNDFTIRLKDIVSRYKNLGIDFEQIGMEKDWDKADLRN